MDTVRYFTNIVLILLGLILFGVLVTILATPGLKNHPYVARTLSAVIIAVGAYIHWGYHNLWTILIVVAFEFRRLQIHLQVIDVRRSLVSSTIGFYTGGWKGVTVAIGATTLI